MKEILADTIRIPRWNIEEACGYKPITTFWQDFSIADAFGEAAVADTFKRAFKEWKGNYKYLTELVLVLNHKVWYHHKGRQDCEMASLYERLWKKADAYAMDNLKGEELNYFICTTD